MRPFIVACVCLLTGCSTQSVRCDRHLTAINVPSRPIAGASAPASAAKRSSVADESGKQKSAAQPAPAADPGGER
jgi:hypothetical protein